MADTIPVAGLPVGTPATVSGSNITVSYLLNNPRVIDRRVGEAVNYRYFADRLLPNVGAPGAGVLIYQEWDPRYSLMDRQPEEIAPDAEVPLAGSFEGEVKVVRATLDGLGYVVTDTMRRQNQRHVMDRRERAFANTISDHFNGRAVAAILLAISASSRTFVATDWSGLVTDGANPDPTSEWPHATLAAINAQQTQQRLPWTYDSMLAHPLDVWRLKTIYLKIAPSTPGPQVQFTSSTVLSVLATVLGLSQIIEDNTGDVPQGSPILFSSGNIGGTAWEVPVTTEIVPERRRLRDVVQCVGSVAYFIDNPYGLLQLTGTAVEDLAA